MKALQYVEIGQPPRIMEVEKPTAGPGQVVLEVTAAGACHSDEFIMSLPAEQYVYGLPLTLGHEGAGIVHEVGPGATAAGPRRDRALLPRDAPQAYERMHAGTLRGRAVIVP